jgi:hypothetical protein
MSKIWKCKNVEGVKMSNGYKYRKVKMSKGKNVDK